MIHCCSAKTNLRALLLIFSVFLFACKKDTGNVGAEFVGIRNGYTTRFDTSFNLNAYTVQMDSVISLTTRQQSIAIGAINDPYLGRTNASLITQFSIPGNGFSWGSDATGLDSAVLQLRFRTLTSSDGTTYPDYYGDKDAIHTLKVYMLDEDLSLDSAYYSTRKYKAGNEIGSWTGKFNFTDSVTIKLGQQTYIIPPHVRIPLNSYFKNLLFTAEARSEFTSVTAFKNTFKGIVVRDETNPGQGNGAIVYVRLNSDVSAITAFYKDSLAADFPIVGGSQGSDAGYNHYEHTDVPSDLIQPAFHGNHRDTSYVQPLTGTKMRIEIPDLFNSVLLSNPKLVINGAEIVFTPLSGTFDSKYTLPLSIALVGCDSLGRNTLLKDQYVESSAYYGGKLNGNRYSFNIVRHLQYLLKEYNAGYNYNYGMNVIVYADNPVTAERIIFDTRKNAGTFKLKLTYTVIQ